MATLITERVLREVYGEDRAQALRRLYDDAKYADIKDQVNLRYWLMSDFDPGTPTTAEERLTHARHAYSYGLMRLLLADKPPGTIAAILGKAAEHERFTPVHLTEAIAAVTGEDVNRELDAFQTFTTRADGIAKYEQQLLTAREEGGDEAALSVIVRLLELKSAEGYFSVFYRTIAVHLRRVGNTAAGASLLHKQMITARKHLSPEMQRYFMSLLLEYAMQSQDMSLAFKPGEAEAWAPVALELAGELQRAGRIESARYLAHDLLTRCGEHLSDLARAEARRLAGQ